MDENVAQTINEEISEEDLKARFEEIIGEVRTQAMLLGGRSMAVVIANMIDEDLSKPGKRTMADMRRIVKKSNFDLEGDALKVLTTVPCTEFSKHHPLNFYLVTQHLQTYISLKALQHHPSGY